MSSNKPKLNSYEDIINLPHHVSEKHPRMSVANRAAQFAPFAALTGYEDAIKETARLTCRKIELDEYKKELLNEQLQLIQNQIKEHPRVSVTYYEPDEKKEGGSYVTVSGNVKKIDAYTHTLIFLDQKTLKIEDILEIDGDMFGKI